jgi:hypothetical protein
MERIDDCDPSDIAEEWCTNASAEDFQSAADVLATSVDAIRSAMDCPDRGMRL